MVMRGTEIMSAAEYRKEVGAGDEIKETPLSAQIAGLMNTLHLENDRIQSGKLYVVTKYTSRKTGKEKEHGRWIQMAKKGTPDRWCLIHKRWILVEVKTKGKKPTAEQITRQRELAAAGAIILNVDSLGDAHQCLTALKKRLDPVRLRADQLLFLRDLLDVHGVSQEIGTLILGKFDQFIKATNHR